MADEPGSISLWLNGLQDGNPEAARPLWERYFSRLAALARERLQRLRIRTAAADGEDAALSAFNSFCEGVARGRFPDLEGRDQLWRLLVTITARKAIVLARQEHAARRGGGRSISEADLDGKALAGFVGDEPTPAFAAQVADEYDRLLRILDDDTLRRIAIWRMEGYTRDEIADKLGCARRTVARQLNLIRTIWESQGAGSE
ncbi:MAG: ECF-type sigma factor [Isosphaeraceae bacterium]